MKKSRATPIASPGLFSSNSDEWETPDDLFQELNKEFNFTLDVCATRENRKVEKFFDKKADGLEQSWRGEICWMNPPYSEIDKWIEKAYGESQQNGATVVALIPARTDTRYFHRFILINAEDRVAVAVERIEIRFVRGRVKFLREDKSQGSSGCPFPSLVVVFNPWRRS